MGKPLIDRLYAEIEALKKENEELREAAGSYFKRKKTKDKK